MNHFEPKKLFKTHNKPLRFSLVLYWPQRAELAFFMQLTQMSKPVFKRRRFALVAHFSPSEPISAHLSSTYFRWAQWTRPSPITFLLRNKPFYAPEDFHWDAMIHFKTNASPMCPFELNQPFSAQLSEWTCLSPMNLFEPNKSKWAQEIFIHLNEPLEPNYPF